MTDPLRSSSTNCNILRSVLNNSEGEKRRKTVCTKAPFGHACIVVALSPVSLSAAVYLTFDLLCSLRSKVKYAGAGETRNEDIAVILHPL